MSFIDGFVIPIPAAHRRIFLDHTQSVVPVFQGFGAGRMVDAWGDDVPKGETTDFHRAVEAREDEAIGFGWIEYPDRATRDAAARKMMSDPGTAEIGEMPFDGKRMILGGFEPVVLEGEGGRAGYVDGFVAAVPTAGKAAFVAHAAKAAPLFLRQGALRVVECWGADVPKGEVTDFHRAVKAGEDETVVFSWVEWPDKATRQAGQDKIFAEMEAHMKDNPMPFDGKRVIFGGFEIVNDTQA